MKSPTSSMAPEAFERPPSARSTQKGGRQLLQLVTNRRIYAIDNNIGLDSSQANINEQGLKSSSFGWPVCLEQNKNVIEDVKDFAEENLNDANSIPLRHLILKTLDTNPIKVQVRCVFMRVGEIDTLNERYYAEILFEASWKEAKLKGVTKREFNATTDWTPQLELMNGIGEVQDYITYSVHHDRQGVAMVTEHHKLKGTFWERMELQYFPLDIQDLSLSITTSRSTKEMIFVKNSCKPSGANRRVFTSEQEWYLFEHIDIEINEQTEEFLEDASNHSVVICSCHAARKYGYFMWNAYFLIFLITSASFTTFPIPLNIINGRIQIACTLLLTSITFRWLCNKALPSISYLTAVDVYAIGSIFSLCLLNIYHGVIGYVNYYITTKSNFSNTTINVQSIIIIDRWALVVYAILFFAYQFGTLLWMYLVPWKQQQIMLQKDKETHVALTAKYGTHRTAFTNMVQATTLKSTGVPTTSTLSNDQNS